jgi:hypothetical protein
LGNLAIFLKKRRLRDKCCAVRDMNFSPFNGEAVFGHFR